MKLVWDILGGWLPAGSMVLAITVAFMQGAPQFPYAAFSGVVGVCLSVVWAAASIKTSISKDLQQLRERLDRMVTKDAMELRLAQERNISDGMYVTASDCDQVHSRLNGIINGKAKGGGA